MLCSVFAPFAATHVISTGLVLATRLSPATVEARFDGIAQVVFAAVIEVEETAVTTPSALIVSGFGCCCDWQPPEVTTTALPPVVPPPTLPFVKPAVLSQFAEMFATSWLQ